MGPRIKSAGDAEFGSAIAVLLVDSTLRARDSARMSDKRNGLKKSKKSPAGVTMDFRVR
jgi:hypothetical protein